MDQCWVGFCPRVIITNEGTMFISLSLLIFFDFLIQREKEYSEAFRPRLYIAVLPECQPTD